MKLPPKEPLASQLLARKLWRRLPTWSHTLILCSSIGILVGLLAALLRWAMDWVEGTLFLGALGMDGSYQTLPTRAWALLLLPTLGGLAAGLLVAALAPEAAGGGTDAVVSGFHRLDLRWPWMTLPVKFVAASLAVGLGLAGGGEGPAGFLGAMIGERTSALVGLSRRQQARFFTAGVAAGVGAFFHAPLGGALFATEVYYARPDLEAGSLLEALLASVTAFTVYNLFHGYHPLLPVPLAMKLDPSIVAVVVLVSLACGLISRWTDRAASSIARSFHPLPLVYRPAAAGLLSGLLAFAMLIFCSSLGLSGAHPSLTVASLGEGYGVLKLAANGSFPLLSILFLMLGLRLLTTALAIGSESPVGSFAPAMVLGAATGLGAGLFGEWTAYYHGGPIPMALAGMTAFFSASFRCPLAAVVMIAEISQGYSLFPVLMLAAVLGYLAGPEPGWVKGQQLSRSY